MKALKARWPFIPEVRLFHDQGKCREFVLREFGMMPRFLEGKGAQTFYRDHVAVVYMSCDGDWHTDAALLCHEACHAVEMHYDHIGEERVGGEFTAYGVQVVSEALFRAHEKWKRKRSGEVW